MPLSCIFRHLAGRHRIIVGTCCDKNLFRVKRFRGTKRVSSAGIWCNLKRFLGTKCCNVTFRCYLKAFPQCYMWRMWLPSFTWLLITWSIPMEAVIGRRPFAQVLRNSLSGHPPSTGHEAWTSVGRSVTKKHYLCTQLYTKTLT